MQPEEAFIGECYRCGYDLRGIANEQPCPECGLLAARSRRTTDELHNTRPRWLRNLSRGVLVILLAILTPFVWGLFIYEPLLMWLWTRSSLLFRLLRDSLPLGGTFLSLGLLLVGVILMTRPEGYDPADRADGRRRFWLRTMAAVPLVGLLIQQVTYHVTYRLLFSSGMGLWLLVQVIIPSLTVVACTPLPILLFHQLRCLAKRARSSHLAEHCLIVGYGAAGALLYITFVNALFKLTDGLRWWGAYWTSRSTISLVLQVFLGTAAALFLLWAIYVLVRFAIAFGRASRQLRKKWRQDDRAAG